MDSELEYSEKQSGNVPSTAEHSASHSLNIPKGGGAIRGMGEKFAANPVTGTGSLSVPITTSPGRSGFGPQLILAYDSGSENGPFGFGWSLSLPGISRKTDKGLPRYQDAEESDVFLLSGAEDLVPALLPDGTRYEDTTSHPGFTIHRYRPRTEGLFARIERWTEDVTGDVHWRSISHDNITAIYGRSNESRIFDPGEASSPHPRHIFEWFICESHDDKGNVIVYEYAKENSHDVDISSTHERNRNETTRSAQRYLKRIRYGNHKPCFPEPAAASPTPLPSDDEWHFEVVFDYGEHDETAPTPGDNETTAWHPRPDPFSSYHAGFEVRTYRLCHRVLMFHHFPDEEDVGADCLVRSTDFTYAYEQDPGGSKSPQYSRLISITNSGYRRDQDGGYIKKSMPPLTFEYSEPVVQEIVEEVNPENLENLPVGLDGSAYRWTDLHGEGIPGILTEQADAWFYKRNLSPISLKAEDGQERFQVRFAALEKVAVKPNLALAAGVQFMDLAGDGQPDLVVLEDPVPGLYEHDEKEGWQPFRPFTEQLHHNFHDPDLRFVDLDGDGHADVLITEEDAFVWHRSLGEAGFGPARRVAKALDEEKGPRLVFADGTQSIYLADLSGDGLTDLVRIRNGEVCYWPNLGYGRFGAKVTMDNAPWFDHPDQFDQKRIRLADIDGSGTTDIIYLHRDGVRLYFNQSGNGWSRPQPLNVFPEVDDLTTVMAIDLLGNGTACLVWSSPLPGNAGRQMRYVNLMGRQKPHLLIRTSNNLGAETRVQYATSTKFFLQDKQHGNPWITRLPFPVHVVERVETYDHISRNRFVTRYAYHHGYFDGEEREFRGFGMVEQWDTEEIGALTESGTFPTGDNWDEASQVPPVYTKTWFHTGVYLDGTQISRHYEEEYYREPGLTAEEAQAQLLPDTVLPEKLSVEEEREACRALKGGMLRQEVYALDGTDKAAHPYTVVEQNFTAQILQPRGSNRHAVFFTHPRESITYHYERNPTDPRIQHALTLEVDAYGNVCKEIAIGYGRRPQQSTLEDHDREKQERILISYTENDFTNSIDESDAYRTPLPAETRTFELTGFTPEDGADRFSFSEWIQDDFSLITTAEEISYEENANNTAMQKRCIEHLRILYRRDDLASLLPLKQIGRLALPGESYTLAFTPGLLSTVYGDRVNNEMLHNEGGYTQSENQKSIGLFPDTDADSLWWIPSGQAVYQADAADHFYLPRGSKDPFGNQTDFNYDSYDLLVTRSEDALANLVQAENDYRVLKPRLITDPNNNRTAVAFDELGMVVKTALMGKEGATDPANSGDTLDEPTTRLEYDQFNWMHHSRPNFVHTSVREQHGSEHTRWQESYSYSDGFGREIQKKVQAEPGPVPLRDADGNIVIDEDGLPVMTQAPASPRWVGSGWTVFNNKGKPVRQYEPFFTDTHAFEFDVRIGVSPVLFYDPVGRVVATLHPNHTYEKVAFDPWRQETWDVNDTVLQADPKDDPDVGGFFQRLPVEDYLPTWYAARIDGDMGTQEQDAAVKTEAHDDTPGIAFLDTLGRAFLTIADNGLAEDGLEQKYETRVELDIEGNQRSVIDARGNTVMQVDYDMAGNLISQKSMDAGNSWTFANVMGNPAYSWKMALDNETDDWQNERDLQFRNKYDELHRPVEGWVKNGAESERLTDKTLYGETENDAESKNLRGKPFQTYDQAGLVENKAFDFKGNLLQSRRTLADEYKQVVDWNVADPSALLQEEFFESRAEFDALNRVIKTFSPHNPQIPASEIIPAYNEANLLNEVRVKLRGSEQEKLYVKNIDYDAKGQRKRIRYGNDAITKYSYDPETFRLTQLETTRGDSAILQDLHYTYDPVGNITEIRDDSQQTHYFNNDVVEPNAGYVYDAIYRLIEASGREHIGQNNPVGPHDLVRINQVLPGDSNAMRRYQQRYEYDEAGNISKTIHNAGNGAFQHSWTRAYVYSQVNNRLLSTLVGNGTTAYGYDSHGNMTTPHLTMMQWDYQDQLRSTSRQRVNDPECTPETTYYVYDASGQRIRKVTECHAGAGQYTRRSHERIYLGGFEIFRTYQENGDTVDLERETLHIMDDQQRIGLVETRSKGDDGTPQELVHYQLNNHLGSSSLELDEVARVISYEEYYPYGSSSYQAVDKEMKAAAKRYRYTGKERDDETGLYYYGARYYAAWLGRWCSCDRVFDVDDNPFAYGVNNPVNFRDPDGQNPESVFLEKFRQKFHWLEKPKLLLEIIHTLTHAPHSKPVQNAVKAPIHIQQPMSSFPKIDKPEGKADIRKSSGSSGRPPTPEPPVRLAGPDEIRWRKNALMIRNRLSKDAIEQLGRLREKLPRQVKPATQSIRAKAPQIRSGAVRTAGKGSLVERIASTDASKVFAIGALAADAAPLFLMSFSPYWCEAAGPWVCGWHAEASKQMDKIEKEESHELFRQAREEKMVETVGPETFGYIHFLARERWIESQKAIKARNPDPYPEMIKPETPEWRR